MQMQRQRLEIATQMHHAVVEIAAARKLTRREMKIILQFNRQNLENTFKDNSLLSRSTHA